MPGGRAVYFCPSFLELLATLLDRTTTKDGMKKSAHMKRIDAVHRSLNVNDLIQPQMPDSMDNNPKVKGE
jgi:hypothetical protein